MHNKIYTIGNMGYKIALIADIHYSINYDTSIFDKIMINFKKNKPNYICITGDILDEGCMVDNSNIDELRNFIKNLSLISSVIISLGNHDVFRLHNAKLENVYKWFMSLNTIENVYFLNNKSLIRDNLCFTGYLPSKEYFSKKEPSKLFIRDFDNSISLNKKYYNILLCHSPICALKKDVLLNSKEINKVDLILSGHMHNGLVFKIFDKKGNIGFISPYKKPFPKFAKGITSKKINEHIITLVISGGVVKLSNCSGVFKHFNNLYPISIEYINI